MLADIPPEPLVAAEVDLRGMPWMPLDTQRLLDSDLFALATAEEFRAAVVLWCKAWQQVPAGSLPSDDRVLAHLSGMGTRWQKVKDVALRGFVLCNDGRLYHSVIAEKVADAWAERVRNREKQRKWREKMQLRNGNADGDVTVTQPVTQPLCNARQGQGQGQGQGHKEEEQQQPTRDKRAFSVERPESVPEKVWTDFLAVRKAKRAPLTATALEGIVREAEKAAMPLADVLTMCCERGWQAFRSEWLTGIGGAAKPIDMARLVAELEAEEEARAPH